ncbi:hypothetical protein ATCC90586_004212 [Pythium insidiosum]|nr:hypothetical protein ATCC90586_004212 [Pythium insidiosum]
MKVAVVAAVALLVSSAHAQDVLAAVQPAQVLGNEGPATPNWVGPKKEKPIDNACYRKSYITTTKNCSVGYEFDKVATCWTECPLDYPVECGMECLPQNADCAKAVIRKVGAVANVALNLASSGVLGNIAKASAGVQVGLRCGQQLFNVVEKIMGYIEEVESGAAQVDTTQEQLLFLLSKSDFAIIDLPIAVSTCLGLPAPQGLEPVAEVAKVVTRILEQIIASRANGVNVLQPEAFLRLTSDAGVGQSISSLKPEDQTRLTQLIGQSSSSCGGRINDIIGKIVSAIREIKKANPSAATDVIRLTIMGSNLVLRDLPAAVSVCFDHSSPDGFAQRDGILKTVHVIIDKIIGSTSQNGKPVAWDKFAITTADFGLGVIAMFDPTGIAKMAQEFVQPICGPTVFIGEIDDGPADQALGLTAVQKAFRGSSGTWAKQGDGMVRVTFQSVDMYDVKVNIMSGGNKVDEVKVPKGQTVSWERPLAQLAGKTMYMDRWRPGFLGLPGTGGGSLLLWVPMGGDGALNVNAQLNPTTFGDKNRRH